MTTARETGIAALTRLMGADRAKNLDNSALSGEFGAAIYERVLTFVMGDVWSSEGLEPAKRSLVTLAILVVQRQSQEIKSHVRIGINNGLTVRELEEMLVQCLPYAGFPAVLTASVAMAEILREMGLTDSRTVEERGLY